MQTPALQTSAHSLEIDLFRQELVNLINNQLRLVQLAATIDWQACETRFDSLYAQGVGRPGHPIRLMVGLQLLKDTSNLSDEEVVALWIENPHWQYFCGEQYFYHHSPIDPSLMTGFRKRIDPLGCEFILGSTVSVVLDTTCARSSRSSGFFAPAGDGINVASCFVKREFLKDDYLFKVHGCRRKVSRSTPAGHG